MRRRVAFVFFALAFLLWALAVPVGEVGRSNYPWKLPAWETGTGPPKRVQGRALLTERGYGLPRGLLRHGEVLWEAWSEDERGVQTVVVVTPVLRAAVLRKDTSVELDREGWRVELGGVVPPSPLLALLFWVLTCTWWVSCEWRWSLDATVPQNALGIGVRMIWPFLLLVSHGWLLSDMGWKPVVATWLHPDLAVALTALGGSGIVVLLVTRPRDPGVTTDPEWS